MTAATDPVSALDSAPFDNAPIQLDQFGFSEFRHVEDHLLVPIPLRMISGNRFCARSVSGASTHSDGGYGRSPAVVVSL